MKILKFILPGLLFLVASMAQAQNLTVTGVVKDSSTGEPVPFASIRVEGTMTGGQTDIDGMYAISAPANAVLVFSSIGYKDQVVPVNGLAEHNVELSPDTEMLEETIVVAFGTATKESFTGSATVVKSDDIAKVQTTDVTRALEGMVAGVQMTTSDGALGSSPSIRIRGTGSIAAGNAPLYIVDGVPYPGDMNNLNTSDIESLTVLKDAASTAVFGVRGANGVILVTTKRGDAGKPKISVSSITGVQQPLSFLTQVGSYEFASFWNLKQQNDGVTDPKAYYAPEAIEAFQQAGILFAPGKAVNAGGVATSGLEMTQNAQHLSWSAEEVDQKLHYIMSQIHQACVTYGEQPNGYINYVKGANIAGFMKVAQAMLEQGVI